ncbi:hypothetical protein E2C01_050505 [Portunus trituberculatus]|uniref:Secreted protein n=1 Tax=Portunus trituberculatus TaxID=210409 RepID=A0A5B7GGP5_PORTR|nr:hypothetical protein [Portunus trituberculatus]
MSPVFVAIIKLNVIFLLCRHRCMLPTLSIALVGRSALKLEVLTSHCLWRGKVSCTFLVSHRSTN